MTDPIGPTMAGGEYAAESYPITFYPDANNYDLVQEGKNPVYYWLPNQVNIARRDGDTGDYKFSLIRFAGLGADEQEKDTVGGLLSLTTTGRVPSDAMEKAQKDVSAYGQGSKNGLWHSGGLQPVFAPVVLLSHNVTLSNIALAKQGYAYFTRTRAGELKHGKFGHLGKANGKNLLKGSPKKDGEIGDWHWVLQGGGPGAIDPTAEHAFAALIGNYPAQVLHAGFSHSTTSPLFASSVMQIQMWTPKVRLKIEGNWDKIYDHFSGHANVHGTWVNADIRLALERLQTNGTIKVSITALGTFPGADKVAEYLRAKSDMVLTKFLEEAQKVIFEPAPPSETPAEASSSAAGASPWGFALALKKTYSHTGLHLSYEEEMQFSHLQEHTPSPVRWRGCSRRWWKGARRPSASTSRPSTSTTGPRSWRGSARRTPPGTPASTTACPFRSATRT
ncbi:MULTISPECIES: hypothetical protein [Streptomyces]|uniref:hypothetical protein n=1 Tax=Streptomyces TaxID=1883 RepID=UPI002248B6FC|nr:hypothetical protein [Streptomyces sp. JHD 1]MCX2971270.1 hypothetical protein [Streptomyces sp. JHD 1]